VEENEMFKNPNLSRWFTLALLLVLVIVFLFLADLSSASSSASIATPTRPAEVTPTQQRSITPTPTSTSVALTGTTTPTVITTSTVTPLESTPQKLTLTVDANGLLNNSQTATTNFKNQVMQQVQSAPFQNRIAGFVLVYTGAPAANDISNAEKISKKVADILQTFNTVFIKGSTVYGDPQYDLGNNSNQVDVVVYLFVPA
jgi:hypothetical protein